MIRNIANEMIKYFEPEPLLPSERNYIGSAELSEVIKTLSRRLIEENMLA